MSSGTTVDWTSKLAVDYMLVERWHAAVREREGWSSGCARRWACPGLQGDMGTHIPPNPLCGLTSQSSRPSRDWPIEESPQSVGCAAARPSAASVSSASVVAELG